MEIIIRHVILVLKITMNQVKKEKSFPEVPNEAIVQPEQEGPETMDLMPEQVENKDEVEYEQMKSADNDMDGDDNPDLDPEA
jgi:hypothetical protein